MLQLDSDFFQEPKFLVFPSADFFLAIHAPSEFIDFFRQIQVWTVVNKESFAHEKSGESEAFILYFLWSKV